MLKFLFLIPVVLCLVWILYLKQREYKLAQGKQGFIYIFVVSATIAIAFALMSLVA